MVKFLYSNSSVITANFYGTQIFLKITVKDLLGELWGDSDEEVSMGDALPPAAEGCGMNDMMSSSNTLQRKIKQLYTSTHFRYFSTEISHDGDG